MWWINDCEAEQMRWERVKDALRATERARLIRAAKGPGESRGWWRPVMLTLTGLVETFTGSKVAEPRRRSLSTVPSSSCKEYPDCGDNLAVTSCAG